MAPSPVRTSFRSQRLKIGMALAAVVAIGVVGVTSAQSDSEPSAFVPRAPVRLVDTRIDVGGSTLSAGEIFDVPIAGVADVPEDATGAMVNVTVVKGTERSYLTAWPSGQDRPLAANVNWSDGSAYPNLVSTALGDNGAISLYIEAGTADVVVDLAGYYIGSAGTNLPGPQGPAGPEGPQGPAGPQGETGSAGVVRVVDANGDAVDGRLVDFRDDTDSLQARVLQDDGYGIAWELTTGEPQVAFAEEVFESIDCDPAAQAFYDFAFTGAPAVPFILFSKVAGAVPGTTTLFRPGPIDLAFDVGSRVDFQTGNCVQTGTGPRPAFTAIEYATMPEVRPAPMTIVADS